MFKVLWQVVIFERWLLFIIGIALAMRFKLVVVQFDATLVGIIVVGILLVVRIIAKGFWLNGNVE